MFTLPEAEQLQVTERAKHKQRYIPHTLKKNYFSGVTQKSKASLSVVSVNDRICASASDLAL